MTITVIDKDALMAWQIEVPSSSEVSTSVSSHRQRLSIRCGSDGCKISSPRRRPMLPPILTGFDFGQFVLWRIRKFLSAIVYLFIHSSHTDVSNVNDDDSSIPVFVQCYWDETDPDRFLFFNQEQDVKFDDLELNSHECPNWSSVANRQVCRLKEDFCAMWSMSLDVLISGNA